MFCHALPPVKERNEMPNPTSNIVREYGQAPFQAIVLHGGPGAPGCAAGLCRGTRELGFNVLEHLQMSDTIEGLIKEILIIMDRYSLDKTTLIGHSFGTWLALMFAAEHPAKARKLILTGCASLEEKYTRQISHTRAERKARGVENTDNYCELPGSGGDMLFFDEAQYKALMAEVDTLRENGELLKRALCVTCPVTAIQGAYDPHPADGIRIPFENHLPSFRMTILEQCGHDPWKETYARTAFFDLVKTEMTGD